MMLMGEIGDHGFSCRGADDAGGASVELVSIMHLFIPVYACVHGRPRISCEPLTTDRPGVLRLLIGCQPVVPVNNNEDFTPAQLG